MMKQKRVSVKWMLVMAAFVGFAFAMTSPAQAQCTGSDNLDFNGECCDISEPILPDFPAVKQEIQYICWRRCDVQKVKRLCVDLGRPVPHVFPSGVPAGCGIYDLPVRTRTCGGQQRVAFEGTVLATYSRTWFEDADVDGQIDTQVYRFLLNGDLRASDFLVNRFGTNPCVPQSIHFFDNLVFWFGYIDYRFDCQNGSVEVEWALDHECDKYHHNEDSGRPAPPGTAFNPARSFTFVGPSTFVPTLGIPFSAGPLVQENTRSILFTGQQQPVVCFRDDPIRDGVLQPFIETCVCTDGAPQYAISEYGGTTLCGSGFGLGQGKEYVQKRLGFFANAAGEPTRELLLKQGDLIFFDQCLQTTTNEYFEGVITLNNVPSFTIDQAGGVVPLARQFHDVGSSNNEVCERKKAVPHYTCKLICGNIP